MFSYAGSRGSSCHLLTWLTGCACWLLLYYSLFIKAIVLWEPYVINAPHTECLKLIKDQPCTRIPSIFTLPVAHGLKHSHITVPWLVYRYSSLPGGSQTYPSVCGFFRKHVYRGRRNRYVWQEEQVFIHAVIASFTTLDFRFSISANLWSSCQCIYSLVPCPCRHSMLSSVPLQWLLTENPICASTHPWSFVDAWWIFGWERAMER